MAKATQTKEVAGSLDYLVQGQDSCGKRLTYRVNLIGTVIEIIMDIDLKVPIA
jgi:hypothetical protein